MKVAILIAAIVIQIIDIFRDYNKEGNKSKETWLYIIMKMTVIVALGYLTINEFLSTESEKQISATHGEINSKHYSDTTFPIIKFGGSIFRSFKALIHNSKTASTFEIRIINHRLAPDVNIRNWDGESVAHFNSEGWEVFTNDIDYNNDDFGFEIRRHDGPVIFQADYRDDTLYCNGLLCSDMKNSCLLGDENTIYPGLTPPDNRSKYWIPENTKITPLFKYPRFQNLGKRAN